MTKHKKNSTKQQKCTKLVDPTIFGERLNSSVGGNEQNQNRNSEFMKCTESVAKGKQIKVVNKTVIVFWREKNVNNNGMDGDNFQEEWKWFNVSVVDLCGV